MAQVQVTISPAPYGSYDPTNPTKNTELWCAQQHKMLEDLVNSGTTYFTDGVPNGAQMDDLREYAFELTEQVFEYAELAITNYRTSGNPNLPRPTKGLLSRTWTQPYGEFMLLLQKLQHDCWIMIWKIYYLWETEEDPLRVKDYIRDMLVAWPLNDIEIQLNEEAGQSFRVYPVWKDADI